MQIYGNKFTYANFGARIVINGMFFVMFVPIWEGYKCKNVEILATGFCQRAKCRPLDPLIEVSPRFLLVCCKSWYQSKLVQSKPVLSKRVYHELVEWKYQTPAGTTQPKACPEPVEGLPADGSRITHSTSS